MKFIVDRKRFVKTIGNLIIFNTIIISLIIFSIIFLPENRDKIMISLFCVSFILLINLFVYPTLILTGSSIIFNDNAIKCIFSKKVRRNISYNEIKDYGTFWSGRDKYIYISRVELSEIQRNVYAFKLYRKTNDVLVLQYHGEVIEFIKNHCHNVYPQLK